MTLRHILAVLEVLTGQSGWPMIRCSIVSTDLSLSAA